MTTGRINQVSIQHACGNYFLQASRFNANESYALNKSKLIPVLALVLARFFFHKATKLCESSSSQRRTELQPLNKSTTLIMNHNLTLQFTSQDANIRIHHEYQYKLSNFAEHEFLGFVIDT